MAGEKSAESAIPQPPDHLSVLPPETEGESKPTDAMDEPSADAVLAETAGLVKENAAGKHYTLATLKQWLRLTFTFQQTQISMTMSTTQRPQHPKKYLQTLVLAKIQR